jgi:Protein of unknown function (DUF1579)
MMRKMQLPLCSAFFLLLGSSCLAQSFPKPGPEHKTLQKMEGTWEVVMTLPGNLKATGKMTCKMECGGMWLVRDIETKIGNIPFHYKGLDGYDPVKKKYISVQFDSLTTVPTLLEGTYDETTKTVTQTGEARDFDGSPEKTKSVLKNIDDDHQLVEVFRVYAGGKEAKHLTIDYSRRKE